MKIVFEGNWEDIREEARDFFAFNAESVVKYEPQSEPRPAQMPETAEPITDKTGCLWDERIHSSSKAMTADGRWKKRRGVDEELYKKLTTPQESVVESEPESVVVPPPPAPPAPPATLTDIISHVAYLRDEMKISELDGKLNDLATQCGVGQFSDLFNPSTAQEIINTFYAKIKGQSA